MLVGIAIGTSVIRGMLTATILTVFLVPVFFIDVRSAFRGRRAASVPAAERGELRWPAVGLAAPPPRQPRHSLQPA